MLVVQMLKLVGRTKPQEKVTAERGFAIYRFKHAIPAWLMNCRPQEPEPHIVLSKEQAEELAYWLCSQLYGITLRPGA